MGFPLSTKQDCAWVEDDESKNRQRKITLILPSRLVALGFHLWRTKMQLRPILAREVRVLTLGMLILMFLFIAPIRALKSYATSWMSQLFGPAVTFSVTNTNDSGAGS